MKKLLTLITATVLTASAGTSIIACGTPINDSKTQKEAAEKLIKAQREEKEKKAAEIQQLKKEKEAAEKLIKAQREEKKAAEIQHNITWETLDRFFRIDLPKIL